MTIVKMPGGAKALRSKVTFTAIRYDLVAAAILALRNGKTTRKAILRCLNDTVASVGLEGLISLQVHASNAEKAQAERTVNVEFPELETQEEHRQLQLA